MWGLHTERDNPHLSLLFLPERSPKGSPPHGSFSEPPAPSQCPRPAATRATATGSAARHARPTWVCFPPGHKGAAALCPRVSQIKESAFLLEDSGSQTRATRARGHVTASVTLVSPASRWTNPPPSQGVAWRHAGRPQPPGPLPPDLPGLGRRLLGAGLAGKDVIPTPRDHILLPTDCVRGQEPSVSTKITIRQTNTVGPSCPQPLRGDDNHSKWPSTSPGLRGLTGITGRPHR